MTPLPAGLSERQYRLFACACARHLPLALRGSSGEAIALAERFADGQATAFELASARFGGRFQPGHAGWAVCWGPEEDGLRMAERAAAWVLGCSGHLEAPGQVDAQERLLGEIVGPTGAPWQLDRGWLAHGGGQVGRLARSIYDGREWELMPILGDALEEAGCGARAVLDHCRGEAEHIRGCWLLDVILGQR
jgi:hypothetical protein